MAAITDIDVQEVVPNASTKQILISTRNTVDAADTIAVDLSAYGGLGTGLIGVIGWKHTTDDSISVQEQPTTSVTGNVLTLTVPAGTDNDPRYYLITFKSAPNKLT